MKHYTVGPWKYHKDNEADYDVMGGDGRFVATVHHDHGDREANAKLIAQAPAMWELLQDIRDGAFEQAGGSKSRMLYEIEQIQKAL